jgi:hypothetical protein
LRGYSLNFIKVLYLIIVPFFINQWLSISDVISNQSISDVISNQSISSKEAIEICCGGLAVSNLKMRIIVGLSGSVVVAISIYLFFFTRLVAVASLAPLGYSLRGTHPIELLEYPVDDNVDGDYEDF